MCVCVSGRESITGYPVEHSTENEGYGVREV